MIAILCPTRGRRDQFKRMAVSVQATANVDQVLIFPASNGNDDYVSKQYPIDMPTVHMWNDLADCALKSNPDIKLFMLGSDDTIFATPGWDQALLDHYNALKNKIHVYHLQDSRDENGTPHPIVTREYIQQMGYFLPPIFLHWFCDTWTVAIARVNRCFSHLRGYELIHDKPSDRNRADDTHTRIRRMGWHQRDSYVFEKCAHLLSAEMGRLALGMTK